MRRAATDITELYAPQFEQFGLQLSGKGAVFTGEVANDRAHGRAWIMPLSPTCIVMEHFITPTHNMLLAEYTPEPYACVSEVSAPTLMCMPEAGTLNPCMDRGQTMPCAALSKITVARS